MKQDRNKKIFKLQHIIIMIAAYSASIVALPQAVREQCVSFAQSHLIKDDSLFGQTIDASFFTPDEAYILKQVIVGLIDAEQTMIKAALFRLTDHDIAQALIDAHKRGVKIEVVIDAGGMDLGHYSKVSALESNEIPLFVYQPVPLFSSLKHVNQKKSRQATSYKSIMHHKTFIFNNTLGGAVVVCGSLNPTHAAFHGNEEMVMIRNNQELVNRWKNHFEKLKRRCIARTMNDYKRDLVKKSKQVKSKKKSRK